jgi:hypothetical protein
MGSVYVTWKGTCRERAAQEELVGFLRELAERSAARLRGPAPARPAFLEVMTAQRSEDLPALEPIRLFDQEITGRIVLDPYLVGDGQRLYEEVQQNKVPMVAVEAGGTEKREPFCLNLSPSGGQRCLGLPRLRVYGLDFRLFDPRQLYPNADRMSFVFLDSPELPALTGCLAQVEDHDQCRPYQSEVIRAADWFVSAPSIHLRYYLEEWSDYLLSWVKYFFVANLYYQRYDELSQHEAIRGAFAELCRAKGVACAKRAAFAVIMDNFEREADDWIGQLGRMGG